MKPFHCTACPVAVPSCCPHVDVGKMITNMVSESSLPSRMRAGAELLEYVQTLQEEVERLQAKKVGK